MFCIPHALHNLWINYFGGLSNQYYILCLFSKPPSTGFDFHGSYARVNILMPCRNPLSEISHGCTCVNSIFLFDVFKSIGCISRCSFQ